MSHDEPGAADHSIVNWDVLFDPTQSSSVPSPSYYILLVFFFIFYNSIQSPLNEGERIELASANKFQKKFEAKHFSKCLLLQLK